MRSALVPLLFGLAGCLQIGTGPGRGGGGGGASGGAASTGALVQADGGSGMTGCVADQTTGTLLCAATDRCPGLSVEQGALPGCGFRPQPGGVLDLECVCGGQVCPVGVPGTCDQAAQLILSQNALVVCEQASLGRCTGSSAPRTIDAGAATSSCTQACQDLCAGVIGCLSMCGC